MSIKKHNDYENEVIRLNDTMTYLENVIYTLAESRIKFKEEIKDAYIHLDFLDSSLSYSSIMMNSKMLDDLEKNFELLMRSRKKPYFSRIDIKHKDKKYSEALYIGKVSLFDQNMESPMVVDWRAPIASVYYDGRLGETTYEVEGQEQTIDLLLKRQYMIDDGKLNDFMDVDISATDTFLQAALGAHASDKLKDIVSTIQGEQNAIIRADINKPLIVQGVAGSGKTTIALHRIAYLIYTFSETFSPENFMIIAPNSLFLDYISQVLPELGADKVKQTTYVTFMMNLIGKKNKMTNHNDKLLALIDSNRTPNDLLSKELIRKSAEFKNSMCMKDVIEKYIEEIKIQMIPNVDFELCDRVIMDYKSINELFLIELSFLPIYNRISKIKLYLSKIVKSESKKMLQDVADDFDNQIEQIRMREDSSETRRIKIVNLMDQRDNLLSLIQKESKNVVNRYMNKIEKKDLLIYYKELMCNSARLGDLSNQQLVAEQYEYIANDSTKLYTSKHFELEDLAALVYLQKFLFGIDDDLDIKNVVIDEAQDFSAFQFYVLRDILKTERFTILGDLSQGIHMYRAIQDWDYLRHHIFKEETAYLTLEQSYRTTIEIMEMANRVLRHSKRENIIYAKPVVRHGDVPSILAYKNKDDVIQSVEKQVSSYKNKGYTTIAIICKTQKEALTIHKKLCKISQYSIALMDDKVEHYNNDIVVIPAHLSKGLEFDAVIICTLEDAYMFEELDIKLLYVAMTRPLHQLSVISIENAMPFFD